MVRTLPFRGKNMGSNPIKSNIKTEVVKLVYALGLGSSLFLGRGSSPLFGIFFKNM